jgi:hypothetical protein
MIAVALLRGATAKAVDTLVITEKSSTLLTAIFDGTPLPVQEISPDVWDVSDTANFFLTGSQAAWVEPENPSEANFMMNAPANGGFEILSDDPYSGPIYKNGAADSVDFEDNTAGGYVPLDVTFNDLGDSGAVPDASTTLALLGFAAATLGFFSKWKRLLGEEVGR